MDPLLAFGLGLIVVAAVAANALLRKNHTPPPQWKGTAEHAVYWVLYVRPNPGPIGVYSFLSDWWEGRAEADWPAYYEWLSTQPADGPA